MKKLLSTLLAVMLAVTMLTGMAIPAPAAVLLPSAKPKVLPSFLLHRKPRDATNSVFKIGN